VSSDKEIRWVGGAYVDLLAFPDDPRREAAIYVLHCFQKKSQAASRQDKAIAETRYRGGSTVEKRRSQQ
jgi:phage-related protein